MVEQVEKKETAAEDSVSRSFSLQERLRFVARKMAPWLKKLVWIYPPLIVLCSMLLTFAAEKWYPFGDGVISWSDMSQQVVPLLVDFKNILLGKDGFFFSFKNAGGMNFYGVFFFYLASPFTFLTIFVKAADMFAFTNILVMLKMCAIAATASVYFRCKYPDRPLLNVILSVLYAYSGYVMMYYVNVIWLDVTYLFPLLLLGAERLKDGKRGLFTVVLASCVIVNFYLSYMLVVFLLLYVFVLMLLSKDKTYAGNFCLCCLTAALLSAVVWLPSLMQYLSSGRTITLMEELSSASILASYQTTLPTVFSILFLIPFALAKGKDKDFLLRKILFLATLLPLILEPVNKMWQTGDYMAFPTRYAFITIFLGLTLAMDTLANFTEVKKAEEGAPVTIKERLLAFKDNFLKNWKTLVPKYVWSLIAITAAALYVWFSIKYTAAHHEEMDEYSHSLWGKDPSFKALLKLYALALLVGVFLYVLYRCKLIKPVCLWLAIGIMAVSELYVAPATYMSAPASNTGKIGNYQTVFELEDQIDDNTFYRVTNDASYSGREFHVTTMGALGYNALGHFTSLTNKEYMTAIKQFGYTSYWMEVGNCGGTLLSDALLSVKYQITRSSAANPDSSAVFEGSYYKINEKDYTLPLGIVAKQDIIAEAETFEYAGRADLQKTLYGDFFGGENAVKTYGVNDAVLNSVKLTKSREKYVLTPTSSSAKATLKFTVPVTGTQTLYFNTFGENTNALNQSVNEKFDISAQGFSKTKYPAQRQNGFLKIGTYTAAENETREIVVTVTVREKVTFSELDIIAINGEKLEQEVAKTETLDLRAKGSTLSGTYTAEGGECVFLSVATEEGLTLRINGKKAKLYEVYDGFTAFYLKEGVNRIEISFVPSGFVGGLCISLLGLGVCILARVFFIRKQRKFELPPVLGKVAWWGLVVVGAAVVVFIYVMPLCICAGSGLF